MIKHYGQCFIVGGAVRDHLLSTPYHDVDFVTDASLDVLQAQFLDNGWTTEQVGLNFNVLFVAKGGHKYEVAKFRKDVSSDGRHAVVEDGDIITDAQRRDFTVNALYYDVFNNVILDPNRKGLMDIDKKILRFVGKPEQRIKEDYLRVFRYYRFLDKLKFNAHPGSLRACREFFKEACDNTVPERIRMELEKMVGLS